MRGNLLANTYMLDDAKRNIPPLAEELYVVVAIVLCDVTGSVVRSREDA